MTGDDTTRVDEGMIPDGAMLVGEENCRAFLLGEEGGLRTLFEGYLEVPSHSTYFSSQVDTNHREYARPII